MALSRQSHADGVVPPIRSLAELFHGHGINRVGFLKVDIEGSEVDLFRSSASWLGRVRRIAMEVYPEVGSVPKMVEQIRSRGMSVELRNKRRETVDQLTGEGGYLFALRAGAG